MLRLYFDYFEEAGQYMRLQVHDSLVNEIPIDLQDQVTEIIYREMTRPVPELRLSASYGMGDALSIGVDIKSGYRWGEVH
jgi:DNA polymerase I-like protein with 3'-5' exonuclease and polymerase domains